MSNPAYIVALVLGSIMLLSVCFVYVRHQVLKLSGMGLAGFAVILVGMSVWKNIDVSVDENGFTAKLEQAIEIANQAKKETAEIKQLNQQTTEATLALKETVDTIRIQEVLRDKGLYKGALIGQLDAETVKSISTFQEQNGIPKTGTLDTKTIRKLGIQPIKNFSNLQKTVSQ
jgi:murein L,D-transpeptidase YcbB/YkuD